MHDTPESTGTQRASPDWVFLLYRIPARPAYARVRVSRRLERLGAIMVKNSVYALPFDEESVEHFQWLRTEIRSGGGEAAVAFVTEVDAETDGRLREAFDLPPRDHARTPPGGTTLEGPLEGRTWVTRKGVGIDRITSAWLIRRRIDANARLKFVPATGYRPEQGEVRFDMYDGEFTHVGDRCTFEVLLDYLEEPDPTLRRIAEMVHDLDLHDDRYEHPETAGLRAMMDGVVGSTDDDGVRVDEGAAMLDRFYDGLGGKRA